MKNKKGQTIAGLLAFLICATLFIISMSLLWRFWLAPTIFLTQVDSAHDIIEDTYDAKNAVANYEWFKNQLGKIRATEQQIDNTKLQIVDFKEMFGEPTKWDWQTKQDYQILRTQFLGQQNHYESLVEDYNAKSSMANKNIFKDDLPFNLVKKLW